LLANPELFFQNLTFKLKPLHPHCNIFSWGGSLGQKTPENSKHFIVPSNLLQFRWFHVKARKCPVVCLMTQPDLCLSSWPLICGCSQQYFPSTWDHSDLGVPNTVFGPDHATNWNNVAPRWFWEEH